MDIGKDILIIEELAKQAGLKVEQFFTAAAVLKAFEKKQDDSRSASLDDKQKLDAYLATLDGNVSPDLDPVDVCLQAGVPRKQGTMSYARWQVKQLLLEHKK